MSKVTGHWVTRGKCKEGNTDRLNLCQPEPTIHERKFYCKKCFKKKTFRLDYKRGDATLGKIEATYEADNR
jgi:hypothetical protein